MHMSMFLFSTVKDIDHTVKDIDHTVKDIDHTSHADRGGVSYNA
jgi:hypothetical protein